MTETDGRRLVSTGSPFERAAGYSRAVAQEPWCFVSGTTGYDYATMRMPLSVAEQTENALRTIEAALAEAGFAMGDVVRVRYILADVAFQDEVFGVTGRWFSAIRPAATMIVAGLIRPEMKVEIEATALRRAGASPSQALRRSKPSPDRSSATPLPVLAAGRRAASARA